MRPEEAVAALERLAPLRLAAPWDNVGVLVEGDRPVRKVLLCIDLVEAVLAEALADEVDLVVAYHPPLFHKISRITRRTPAERIVCDALRARITVFSPHTALDAVQGGMTDFLVAAAGPVIDVQTITPTPPRDDPALQGAGMGRVARLVSPCTLRAAVARIKATLGLKTVRVSPGQGNPEVRTLAACPGSGGSVLRDARGIDLVLTGEMGHHEVLAFRARGISVVLTEHSHSERAFLPVWVPKLQAVLPGVAVAVSRVDDDPLSVW